MSIESCPLELFSSENNHCNRRYNQTLFSVAPLYTVENFALMTGFVSLLIAFILQIIELDFDWGESPKITKSQTKKGGSATTGDKKKKVIKWDQKWRAVITMCLIIMVIGQFDPHGFYGTPIRFFTEPCLHTTISSALCILCLKYLSHDTMAALSESVKYNEAQKTTMKKYLSSAGYSDSFGKMDIFCIVNWTGNTVGLVLTYIFCELRFVTLSTGINLITYSLIFSINITTCQFLEKNVQMYAKGDEPSHGERKSESDIKLLEKTCWEACLANMENTCSDSNGNNQKDVKKINRMKIVNQIGLAIIATSQLANIIVELFVLNFDCDDVSCSSASNAQYLCQFGIGL
jgi:hypothetical protein